MAAAISALGCAEIRSSQPDLASAQLGLAPGSDGQIGSQVAPAADKTHDYVVRVVAGAVTCSGALIAPDQVLTAHHCVSAPGTRSSISHVPLRRIHVELGGGYLPWDDVTIRAVVAPPCGYAAGAGDIAILVLDRAVSGVPLATPRLDAGPRIGEAIEPVGFGRCALASDGIRRAVRPGGKIAEVRAGAFRLQAAICPGDSGGPGLRAATGEIVGVISASAMDEREQTRGLSEFTRLDAWRSVFATAERLSKGVSAAELPPIDCPHSAPAN